MSEDKVIKLGEKRDKKVEKSEQENSQDSLVYCSFCHRPNTQV